MAHSVEDGNTFFYTERKRYGHLAYLSALPFAYGDEPLPPLPSYLPVASHSDRAPSCQPSQAPMPGLSMGPPPLPRNSDRTSRSLSKSTTASSQRPPKAFRKRNWRETPVSYTAASFPVISKPNRNSTTFKPHQLEYYKDEEDDSGVVYGIFFSSYPC
jgi:hypothetical protein